MRKHYRIHHPHFIVLLLILILGGTFILFFNYDRDFQIASVVGTSLAYIMWGVLHHLKHKDLEVEIIMEYLLIALFGATILISIILKT